MEQLLIAKHYCYPKSTGGSKMLMGLVLVDHRVHSFHLLDHVKARYKVKIRN